MKDKITLSLFCMYLIICSVISKTKETSKEVFRHYYFLQKLYPGTNSITSFVTLKQKMNIYFFTLDNKKLFYTKNALEKKIEGTKSSFKIDNIILSKLVDNKIDNLSQGKCCANINFVNFATTRKSKRSFKKPASKTVIMDILRANYCLDIFIPNEVRWRLCSDKAKHISKLQLQMEYNILLSSTGKKDSSIISINYFNQLNSF